MSDNVEYLGSIQQDVGLTTGAKVLGDRMFVTSGKNISIYDITDPAAPKALGGMKVNVAWENEEVPTNGKVLAVASDFYSVGVPSASRRSRRRAASSSSTCATRPTSARSARSRSPTTRSSACSTASSSTAAPARSSTRAGSSTAGRRPSSATGSTSCGAGRRRAQLPPHPRDPPGRPADRVPAVRGDLRQRGGRRLARAPQGALHRAGGEVRALRPLAARGRRPLRPDRRRAELHRPLRAQRQRVLRLQRRPRAGRAVDEFEGPLAQVPPAGNGVYADGKPVAGALGCSVHWFHEHPTFSNGGLVAISEYEDGVRFLQIKPDGQIEEQGYFLSLGSSSSSPKWAGKDDVLYSIDYMRGIDILRWKGEHYVPGRPRRSPPPARQGEGDRRRDAAEGAERRPGRAARRPRRRAAQHGLVARRLPARRAELTRHGSARAPARDLARAPGRRARGATSRARARGRATARTPLRRPARRARPTSPAATGRARRPRPG